MIVRSILILLIISTYIPTVFSQERNNKQKIAEVENGLPLGVVFQDSSDIRYNIIERMQFYKVPLVSMAIVDDGKILWSKAYGKRKVASVSTADVNTIYQTASISKSINALAVLKLVQEGKISLQKDIREYLKTWELPNNKFSTSRKITLANLLSHTSGLGTVGFFGYKITDTIPSLNQILSGIKPANSDPVQSINFPGAEYFYSGGGTTLIRKILEDRFKTNYASLIQTNVLTPLNMKRSTYNQPLQKAENNFASGYVGDGQVIQGGYHVFPELAPDGLWSNANDIAKFILSIQKSLKGENALLQKHTVLQMFSKVLPTSNYTLGFVVEDKGDEKYFSHRGANYGYRSVFYGSMKTGKGIVVLTNSENGEMLINEVVNSVAIAYDWKGFYNPPVKKLVNTYPALIKDVLGKYSNGEANFTITNNNGKLEMIGNSTESLHFVGNHRFFLLSSPNIEVVFSSSDEEKIYDVLELRENGNVLIKALRNN